MEMRRTQRTSTRGFISRHGENMAPRNDVINGVGSLLFRPPPLSLSHSYPPSTPPFNNQSVHNYQKLKNQQQPPLISLPISLLSRGLSCPPNTRKANRAPKEQSLTPRKAKQPPPNIREKEPKQDSKSTKSSIIGSVSPSGPDPNDLPKLEKLSGSLFTFSPPPSSLPLPKFSLRPQLSCNSEAAAGIDAGATDSLRRMLRIL